MIDINQLFNCFYNEALKICYKNIKIIVVR